jgi:hypothetical protein
VFGFGKIVSGRLPQSFNREIVVRLPRQAFGASRLLLQIVDPAHDAALN